MAGRTIGDIEKIWANVEGVKRLSDRVVGVGPFGLGLDGLLTWFPLVGSAYSVGAGGWLLWQGVRSRASARTLARMAGFLGLDLTANLIGEVVPFAPDVVDLLFPGHLLAARALQAEIEATHWVEASGREARASGEHERREAEIRAGDRFRRVVYLRD